jgi:hypothetical protein
MIKTWMKIIAVLEIVGGVYGAGFSIWWLLSMPLHPLTPIIGLIAISIYALSFIAGAALWRGTSFGRKASIIVQAIQVPKIISPLVIFMFSFGFDLWVHLLQAGNLVNLGFEIRLLAFNQFFINMEGAPVGIGVSVSACVFLTMLLNYDPQTPATEELPPPPPPPVEWNNPPGAAQWNDAGNTQSFPTSDVKQ